ncbi:MAG: DUF2203 domain-containing protein [Persephonella sp.]|nr:MAG: DUF2203 domain-containing protein [Persephonella sp.]
MVEKKYFTLKEAKAILPQVKLLVDEIVEKREMFYDKIEKYEDEENDRNDELELMYLKTEIVSLNQEINELIEIIESFGAYVKGLDPLLIDFPSLHNGKPIFLCWEEGEETIEYWHGIEEGYKGRKHISLLIEDRTTKGELHKD